MSGAAPLVGLGLGWVGLGLGWLVYWFVDLLVCWLGGWLGGWVAGLLVCWLADLVVCLFVGLLAGWLVRWLAGWLVVAGITIGNWPTGHHVPLSAQQQEIQKKLDLPFQLYAPYFCMDTPYANDWPMLTSDTKLPGCGVHEHRQPFWNPPPNRLFCSSHAPPHMR